MKFNSKSVSEAIVLLAFLLSLVMTLSLGVMGTDIFFHLKIAEAWSVGDVGKAFQIAVSVNGVPYPPLLHFILVPLIWVNSVNFGVMVLQIVFYTLSIALCMRYAKVSNRYIANLSGIFLLSSVAFFDRSMQVQPQALDMMLIPILLLSTYKRNYSIFSIASILLFLNHGYLAIFLVAGAWVYNFYKIREEFVLDLLMVVLPFIFLILIAFQNFPAGAINSFNTLLSTPHNSQLTAFLANPLGFTLAYQGIVFYGSVFAVLELITWNIDWLSDFDKLNLLVLLGLLPMLFFWGDRFLQYSTIPLSMILASNLYRIREYLKRDVPNSSFTLWYVGLALIFFLVTFTIMSGA